MSGLMAMIDTPVNNSSGSHHFLRGLICIDDTTFGIVNPQLHLSLPDVGHKKSGCVHTHRVERTNVAVVL